MKHLLADGAPARPPGRWRAAAAAALAAALLAAALPAAQATTNPKASRLYEDALQRFDKRDFAGAAVQLRNAIKLDRNNLPVQLLLGRALLAQGSVGQAEVAFDEALRLGVNRAEVVAELARAVMAQGRPQDVLSQPRFATAGLPPAAQSQLLLLRASAMSDLGDVRSALRAVEEARALEPNSSDSWMAEAAIRIRSRQQREALLAADKALLLSPGSAEALYLRGSVAHVQGEVAAALGWYDKALAAQPAHTEGLVSRAGVLLDLGRFDDAARDVAELLRTSPREPRANYMQALLAERSGDKTAARSALNAVTALLDPLPMESLRYRPQLLMLGGLSHYGLRQFEKAKPYLELAQRTQGAGSVSKLLGQIYLTDKNFDRGVEALETYLKTHPGDRQAVLLLGSAYMTLGRHARATTLAQDALRLDDSADVRTILGLSLVGSGRFGDAVGELEAAFKKDPRQVQAGTALITVYLQTEQAAKAVAVADALVKQQPKNPGLVHLLGVALDKRGDEPAARAALEQSLKLDPKFSAPLIALARIDAAGGAFDKASARLNAILAREPNNIEAFAALATVAERRGQAADAQRWLEKADDHAGPANVQPGLALIDFQLRQGRPELAREAVKRVSNRAPGDIQVLLTTARVALANGDAAGARGSLTRAATLANFNAPTLVRIALLQLEAGHVPGAAHSLGKALGDRPDLLPAQVLMTEVEIRQGEFAKADQRARQIVARNPKLGIGPALLGDLALARGHNAAAVEHYRTSHKLEASSQSALRLFRVLAGSDAVAGTRMAQEWLRANPNDVVLRRALGDEYARTGNMAAAREAYESLLKLAPKDPEALNNLANVLLLQNDPAALRVAERALGERPGAAHIIGTVGWAAFKSGQTDRALQLLRDARLRNPDNPDTRYFLGAVLAEAGRTSEARSELEGALKDQRPFTHSADAQALLRTLK